jgi:hypothetical protein
MGGWAAIMACPDASPALHQLTGTSQQPCFTV